MPLPAFFVLCMLRRVFSLLRWATFGPLTIALAVGSAVIGAARWLWPRWASRRDAQAHGTLVSRAHAVYMTATWLNVCQKQLLGQDSIVPVDELLNVVTTYLVAEDEFRKACRRARRILK